MALVTLEHSAPLSSAEFATIDLERMTEIARRHQAVGAFLKNEGYSALLLQSPANIAWMTAGEHPVRCGASTTASLFVTPDARVVVCNNAETTQYCEHLAAGLGFQLKERSWTEPRSSMLSDLCRGRKVASDGCLAGTVDVGLHVQGMRLPLSTFDINRIRQTGRLVAHAVEATGRGLTAGRTEADIAGELSHRLVRHGVTPERLQIWGDGHGRRFRQWTYSDTPVQGYCTISAVARSQGLYVGVARTVTIGNPSSDLLEAYEKAALVTATGMFFTQSGWELFEVWQRVKRIYEKCGAGEEWRLAEQADVVEFEYGAVPLMPTSEFRLFPGVPIYWHPSVDMVGMGETVLATDRGAEWLTPCTDWPKVPITVKGTPVEVPGILIVPAVNGHKH